MQRGIGAPASRRPRPIGYLNEELPLSSRMHGLRRHVLRGRAPPCLRLVRQGALRPLRSRRGGTCAEPRRSGVASRRHVALLRAHAGAQPRQRGEPGGGLHADHPSRPIGRSAGLPGPADQGRGGQSHVFVQGPRTVGRGIEGRGARRDGVHHTVGRQRGRRGRRVRRARRRRGPRLHAEGRADRQPRGGGGRGRPRRAGRRPDIRRGQGVACRRRGARPVRRVDPAGAIQGRGQEDDGVRDRGAAGLERARRDRLPDRGRHGDSRHLEGLPGDGGPRLARRPAAQDVLRAGRGMRSRSSGPFTRARTTPSRGSAPRPSRRASGSRPR